jgi:tetratricopeptide (TPR) repeat protein
VSFGDATTIDFPRSGIELHVSTLFHKLDDAGERGDITPVAVPAPFSFSEYAAGRDPAVDAILRGDEMRSLATIAIESGAEAARNVYEIRKTRYGETPEWFAPRRIDLLHAIWKMEDQNHVADAARFAALATDIYPNSARVWAVRGDVETNAGQKAEALQSYRRSLEIDPNNLDNISERKVLAEARVPVPE